MKFKRSSVYWRVEVQKTGETITLFSKKECMDWIEKVKNTFGDQSMRFDVFVITEKHCEI